MSASERAKALESLLNVASAEADEVKQAAVGVLAASESEPMKTAEAVKKVLIATQNEAPAVKRDAVASLTSPKPPTSADKVLIVFTPLLTGLLGLFAPSPSEMSGTNSSGR
jgi:hypothetical protein